jgi:heat shock protein HslJ
MLAVVYPAPHPPTTMKKTLLPLALPLLLTLLLAACGGQPEPAPEAAPEAAAGVLAGTSWLLQRIEAGDESMELASMEGLRAPELQFAAGDTLRVAGSDGCNRITGSYALEGDGRITFSAMASTRMACPPPVEEVASRVTAVLTGNTAAYEVEGDMLQLSSGETVLHYARQ